MEIVSFDYLIFEGVVSGQSVKRCPGPSTMVQCEYYLETVKNPYHR